MGESRAHARLVDAIVSWVRETCDQDPGVVLIDSGNVVAGTRPPAIGSYIPDVYVSRANGYAVIVGEAKTARDLERPHSQAQLAAYLGWCARHENSLLLVAVPWYVTRAARNMIGYLQRTTQTHRVQTIVLDQIAG